MSTFHNRTRKSSSIPKRLVQNKLWHLVPIYYLMLTSELAREGIENSGSYRFADHIYARRPRGKYGLGLLLDAVLLKLPSATSMRSRYLHAKDQIIKLAEERKGQNLDVLATPSGLARELFEAADELNTDQINWHGLDLDKELIEELKQRANNLPHKMHFWAGDALSSTSYKGSYDIIISIGLAEFIDDDQLINFYVLAFDKLKPGGRFITSGMLPHPLSDYLLRNIAEIQTIYRSEEDLTRLAKSAGFTNFRTIQDKHRLQTILITEKDI